MESSGVLNGIQVSVVCARLRWNTEYITFHVILCISSLEAAFKEKAKERERELDALRNKTVESFNCDFHESQQTHQEWCDYDFRLNTYEFNYLRGCLFF